MDIENLITDKADITVATEETKMPSEEQVDAPLLSEQDRAAQLDYHINGIVDAGAGAGKTTLLTKKVAHLIGSPELSFDADRIAIMTFTRNAAAELRARMSKELYRLSAECEDESRKKYIRAQLVKFRRAPIVTINAFCLDILKDNIQLFDLPASFTIIEDAKAKILQEKALEAALEVFYSEFPEDERDLLFRLFSYKDDTELQKAVKSLYNRVTSLKNYDKWLDTCVKKATDSEASIQLTNAVYCTFVHTKLTELKYRAQKNCDTANGYKVTKKNADSIDQCKAATDADKAVIDSITDKIIQFIKTGTTCDELHKFMDALGDAPFVFPDANITIETTNTKKTLSAINSLRAEASKSIEALKSMLPSGEDIKAQAEQQATIITSLVKLLKLYDSEYKALKSEQGYVDFADCEHKLLAELSKDDSLLKKSLISRYDLIIIDEFQDTSDTQYAIFEELTGEDSPCSLFVVGDVKQAIYAFRGGNPTIMAALCESPDFERISLNKNYRSRKNVLCTANEVCKRLITKQHGDINYDDTAMLRFGNTSYDDADELLISATCTDDSGIQATNQDISRLYDSELHILTPEKGTDEAEHEAAFIANKIKSMIKQGFPVTERTADGVKLRPCKFGDFGVLVRYNKNITQIKRSLEAMGIPVDSSRSESFLESEEISLILNYLRIIDNPMREKALLAVLMSPVVGMTAEDIAQIKLGMTSFDMSKVTLTDDEKPLIKYLFATFRPLYSCVNAAAKPFDSYKAAHKDDADYISAQKRIEGYIATKFSDDGKPLETTTEDERSFEDSLVQFFADFYRYHLGDDDCYQQLTALKNLILKLEKAGAIKEQGDSRCDSFVKQLNMLRSFKTNNSVERLVRKVYDATDMLSIVSVFDNSERRAANLRQLLKYVAGFEGSGGGMLSDFLRYAESTLKNRDNNTFTEAANAAESSNAVRLMTIHGSKGLEMPICFVAQLGVTIKNLDKRQPYVFHRTDGIAVKYLDTNDRHLSSCIPYSELSEKNDHTLLGEELRLLYVAMTRAREKLIMTSTVSKSALKDASGKMNNSDADEVFKVHAPVFWILSALLKSCEQKFSPTKMENVYCADALAEVVFDDVNAERERKAAQEAEKAAQQAADAEDQEAQSAQNDNAADAMVQEAVTISPDDEDNSDNKKSITAEASAKQPAPRKKPERVVSIPSDKCYLPEPCANEETAKRIAASITKKYANEKLTATRSRYTVTEVAHMIEAGTLGSESAADRVYIGSPEFVSSKAYTGKEIGDAYHHAMQFYPFDGSPDDVEDTLNDLLAQEHITDREFGILIKHPDKIAAFLNHSLCRRAVAAMKLSPANLQREKAFLSQVSTAALGISTNDVDTLVFLQGRIDMFFIESDGIVLVDYKSDSFKNLEKELDAYAKQLRMYNDVLFEITGLPVKEIYIYSFAKNDVIPISPKE